MKKPVLIFTLCLGIVFFTNKSSLAQYSASATAAVNIVSPIAITKNADMSFGNIAATGTAGTVILAPGGTRSKTGGITLTAVTGTVSAATFTVTGQASFTYSVTLPGSAVTLASGGNSMTAGTFTSSPSATGTLSAGGTQVVTVGATLNVAANQAAGTYTTATPFSVTVNYN